MAWFSTWVLWKIFPIIAGFGFLCMILPMRGAAEGHSEAAEDASLLFDGCEVL